MKKRYPVILLVLVMCLLAISGNNIFANEEDIQKPNEVEDIISSNEDKSQDIVTKKDVLNTENKLSNTTETIIEDVKNTSLTMNLESPTNMSTLTSNWGTSVVHFDESTGTLVVEAGQLRTYSNSSYLDLAGTIKKADVKKIIFEDNVVAPANSSYLFSGDGPGKYFYNLKSIIGDLDTSQVTEMEGMFVDANSLTDLDVSNWDTSKVKSMTFMFIRLNNLTSLDVSNWNTSNVTQMHNMFNGTNNLKTLDVSNWDTSKVTIMINMFLNTNIQELVLGKKSIFNSTVALPMINLSSSKYSGKWERINPVFPESVFGSSTEFMSNYDGSNPGTYAWQKTSYTISYELDGGTNALSNPSDYTYGVGVPSFANPSKTGYTFLGWVDGSNNLTTNISTTTIGNKTLTATWKVNIYTIIYKLDGGTNSLSNPNEYTYGIGVPSFANPSKTGYTFLGWVDGSNNLTTNISTTTIGNKTLTATWKVNIYTIIYELDGGTNSLSNPNEYTYGIGVPSFANPSKDGYTFLGWVDGSNNLTTNISTTTIGNKTLTATWKVNIYTIIYELDGGTNSLSNPNEYTYGIGVPSFGNPSKDGYTFLGWVDGSDTSITDIGTTITGNITLTARWEVVKAKDEKISYISAIADGSVNTETSTKITIKLSNDITTLNAADIILSNTNIKATNLTSLGNGVYELAINGDWNEGTLVDVSFTANSQGNVIKSLNSAIITPKSQTATLHKKTNKDGQINNNTTKNSSGGNKVSSSPQTGYNDSPTIMMHVVILLITGNYLISGRKKYN